MLWLREETQGKWHFAHHKKANLTNLMNMKKINFGCLILPVYSIERIATQKGNFFYDQF